MNLNREEQKEFREKINKLFRELRKKGFICRKNFSCCSSCGHAEMPPDRNYVFYNKQEGEKLREGHNYCYLAHSIQPELCELVKQIVHKYDSTWSGFEYETIMIPFR
jgi:hypothetical protein